MSESPEVSPAPRPRGKRYGGPLFALAVVGAVAFGLYRHTMKLSWRAGVAGYQTALREQQQSGKPLAIFFYADGCAPCERLDREVLSTDDFQDGLKDAIKVRLNPGRDAALQPVADQFGVRSFPTFVVARRN